MFGGRGDRLQHVLDDEGEGGESADDQEVGHGALDPLAAVLVQGLLGSGLESFSWISFGRNLRTKLRYI
jgi:hypothetical protein